MGKDFHLLSQYSVPISDDSSMIGMAPMMNTGSHPIIWMNEFTEEATRDFFRKFNSYQSDDRVTSIVIYIDSIGGDVTSLSAICELIENSEKPVITVAVGKAMSAGAILLSLGTPGMRYAGSMTSIMFHRLRIMDFADEDVSSADLWVRQAVKENEMWIKRVVKQSKISWKKFNDTLREKNGTWDLKAKEALECGFIDHIGIPMLREIHQIGLVV